MERKLKTKRGRALYRKRSQVIEPVFGQIKTPRDLTNGWEIIMNVGDIMTKNPLTVKPDEDVEKIYFIFNTQHVRHLPVVEKGRMVGFLSDRDLKKIMPKTARKVVRADGKTYSILEDSLPHGALMFMRSNVAGYIVEALKVREIMHTEVFTVSSRDNIADAAAIMAEKKIGALPVLDNGKLVGIVTTTDILRGLLLILAEGSKPGGGKA